MSDDQVFCRPCTCERCRRNYTDKFCSICCFESGNAFIDDLIANSFDDLLNSSDYPPQHQTYTFESYNDNPNYGYPLQEPFVYNQDSCYEQNFVDNLQSPPQPQYETYSCELCGNDAHYGYDCLPQVLDEHLSTIPKTESDEVIKSSVEDLVPIPSESEGISDDTCDVPSCDNSHPLDVFNDHFKIFSDFNDDCTSSNDDSFEDIDYVEASPPEDSIIIGNEELSTKSEKELDEYIKSSVEDLVTILSESEDTSGSESVCILPSCDDFYPIDILKEKDMTFSNPLFNSSDDFISSDDESLSDEDVPESNFKIYSKPLFEFDDEYISSDVNPLFDKMLEDIECKNSYDPNIDESTFLVTPLSDSNEDEYFTLGDDVELLLHHDPSIPKMSVASILEGFIDESPLEENDNLFDLESMNDEWKKISMMPKLMI
nr:hypothetical protein [Tanacetum cinerariifolium]